MSLKHAILAALSLKPQTGYDLSCEIDGSLGNFWSATHQQVYKELGELETREWLDAKSVSQAGKPDKKVYRLSATGRKELKAWIAAEAELPPAKDALLIKLFVGHLVEPKILLSVLGTQAVRRRARLDRYLAIEAEHFQGKRLSREAGFQYLAVRRGIRFERAWLEWAEDAETFIRKG